MDYRWTIGSQPAGETGIYWHQASKRWAAKVGYRRTRRGNRSHAVFYFVGEPGDRPPGEVVEAVVAKREEWGRILRHWMELKGEAWIARPQNWRSWAKDLNPPIWPAMYGPLKRPNRRRRGQGA